jgi:hypothetical protein
VVNARTFYLLLRDVLRKREMSIYELLYARINIRSRKLYMDQGRYYLLTPREFRILRGVEGNTATDFIIRHAPVCES